MEQTSHTTSCAPPNPSLAKGLGPFAPAPKIDWKLVPKKERHVLRPQFIGVQGNSKLKLAKPLTKKARRIIANKTRRLMERRDEIDAHLREEVERPLETLRGEDWLPRHELLLQQDHLQKREKRHIRRRTLALEQRERLYRWDPTTDRAIDLDLIRSLLWRFKRHLGPAYISHHKDLEDEGEDDAASSDEEGGADPKAPSKDSNGDDSSSEEDYDDQSDKEGKTNPKAPTKDSEEDNSSSSSAEDDQSDEEPKKHIDSSAKDSEMADTLEKAGAAVEAPSVETGAAQESQYPILANSKRKRSLGNDNGAETTEGPEAEKEGNPGKKAKTSDKTITSNAPKPTEPKPDASNAILSKTNGLKHQADQDDEPKKITRDGKQDKASTSKALTTQNAQHRSNDEVPRPPPKPQGFRKRREWEMIYNPLEYDDLVSDRPAKRQRHQRAELALMSGASEGFPENFVDKRQKCKKIVSKKLAPPPGYKPSPEKPKAEKPKVSKQTIVSMEGQPKVEIKKMTGKTLNKKLQSDEKKQSVESVRSDKKTQGDEKTRSDQTNRSGVKESDFSNGKADRSDAETKEEPEALQQARKTISRRSSSETLAGDSEPSQKTAELPKAQETTVAEQIARQKELIAKRAIAKKTELPGTRVVPDSARASKQFAAKFGNSKGKAQRLANIQAERERKERERRERERKIAFYRAIIEQENGRAGASKDDVRQDTTRVDQSKAVSAYSSPTKTCKLLDCPKTVTPAKKEIVRTNDSPQFALIPAICLPNTNISNVPFCSGDLSDDPFTEPPSTPAHRSVVEGVFTPGKPPNFTPRWTPPSSPAPAKKSLVKKASSLTPESTAELPSKESSLKESHFEKSPSKETPVEKSPMRE